MKFYGTNPALRNQEYYLVTPSEMYQLAYAGLVVGCMAQGAEMNLDVEDGDDLVPGDPVTEQILLDGFLEHGLTEEDYENVYTKYGFNGLITELVVSELNTLPAVEFQKGDKINV